MNIVYSPQISSLQNLLTEIATGHGFYEGIAPLEDGSFFAPDAGTKIYRIVANEDASLSFDLAHLDLKDKAITFETWITVASPSVTISLPSTQEVDYLSNIDPSTTSENETLYLAWRIFRGVDGNPVVQGSLYHKGRG